jgi:hypothetical protein
MNLSETVARSVLNINKLMKEANVKVLHYFYDSELFITKFSMLVKLRCMNVP